MRQQCPTDANHDYSRYHACNADFLKQSSVVAMLSPNGSVLVTVSKVTKFCRNGISFHSL